MNKQFRRFFGRDEEEGQALILFAILMLALLFAVGLAIDAGQLYTAKRTEQEAADAAAFAGAVVIYQSASPCNATCQSAAIAAARTDAATNGYGSGACAAATPGVCTDAATATTVEVNYPPLSGAYVGNMKHVEVIITRQVKTSLVPAEAVFNPVRARGVAGSEPLNNGYAIMALNRGGIARGFWNAPNGSIALHGGGILVNSTDGDAAENDQTDSSKFKIDAPYPLDVTGQATGPWFTIPVNSGHAQVGDPFAGFPKPYVCAPPPPCSPVTPVYNSLPAPSGGVTTLDPGIYKVLIKGTGNDTFFMNPGIYILEAGMDTSGNGIVTGNNVFIYNTYTTYPLNPGLTPTCSDVNLTGNGALTFTATTTLPYANLLFYQDPACTNDFQIGGNGTFTGTGSIYLPAAPFVLDGNNATLIGSQLIAQTVQIQNGNITINYDPTTTAQPILPRLAE